MTIARAVTLHPHHSCAALSALLLPLLLVAAGCGGDDIIKVHVPATGGAASTGGQQNGTGGELPGAGGATGGSSGGTGTGGAIVSVGGTLITSGGAPVQTVDCAGALPSEEVSGAAHRIQVESNVSWGHLPHFWDTFGTGHLGLYLMESRTNFFQESWGPLLHEATRDGVANLGMKRIRSHGLFHDDIGIYGEDDQGQPVYNFEKYDQIFDFLVEELGIVPLVELGPMPSQLASDPSRTVFDWGMGISPPKDYAIWQDLIENFVRHNVERYGIEVVSKWDWEVWNEPECCNNKFWSGTLEEYFTLFDHTAAGVRAVIPDARVGGPVSSQPVELRDNSRAGELFLDHITNPESPQDLGFFSYHSWSFVGGAVDGYFQGLDLLNEYGLSDTPIAITEFGPTWEFNLYDEPQEMSQGAAFVAQVFSDISRRAAQEGKRFPLSYSWWVLSDVFEEEMYREDELMIGCMGLISREGIKKPAYNAYKFLTQMGNQQLVLVTEGEGDVGGMAALDENGGIQVIIYHGQDPGRGPGDDTYYAVAGPTEIGLTLSGLNPEVAYDVREYRVDEAHGNAYQMWEDLGRPKMADLTEADWQTFRDNMESPEESLGEAACGGSMSKTFNLSSPGVLFITLTPAVAATAD